jgi:hypothetical protein
MIVENPFGGILVDVRVVTGLHRDERHAVESNNKGNPDNCGNNAGMVVDGMCKFSKDLVYHSSPEHGFFEIIW